MGTTDLLLSVFGWTFIPDFATKHLLNFVYYQSPFRIVAAPPPGSPKHRRHYAITYAVVIFSYLSYTLFQSARTMPPNFYQILGVPPDVDENGLKFAFRAFAKRYHPDKPGVGKDGELLFMYVRDAFEALKDPVVRFAYDRFGPDVLGWRNQCKTTREFVRHGLLVSSGYHIVAGIILLFMSAIGRPSVISFWRYVLFAALLAGELSFILSPFPASQSSIHPPSPSLFSFLGSSVQPSETAALSLARNMAPRSFLQTIFPNRIPYQHILFLHQVFMFMSVAVSRVYPRFVTMFSEDGSGESKQLDALEKAVWERVYGTLAIADREASVILHTVLRSIMPSNSPTPAQPYHDPTLARMHPLSPSQTLEALEKVSPTIRDLIIEANIKNQTAGPIAVAWDAALRKALDALILEARTNSTAAQAQTNMDGAGVAETSSPTVSAAAVPITPRAKNFWEKDTASEADDLVTLVSESDTTLVNKGSESRPASPHKTLGRVPSTPRLASGGSGRVSPTKSHSPVRKASFGGGAGEF
ncbi:Chaperone protein DnaJ [Psilocybe cubensis]|uniref:J domain-containing protein n=2 Tax=Psilocybe cubensis TaxID=181762 RepID=A0A8H7Y911_PSICU|nr:Chaperone protein DnaJ [Psilocybe cubensis]KAH9485695.1 Chaperone protein DnaJ [Psilocybe cubensis]